MNLHGVECERVEPFAPEAYLCLWAHRNKLALGLLGEGKGTVTHYKRFAEGAKAKKAQDFALIEVNCYVDVSREVDRVR